MTLDASVERTIVSMAVMLMSTILLIIVLIYAPSALAAMLPLIGTWMGALIANWFNGIQTPTIPISKGPSSTTTTTTVAHTEGDNGNAH